MNHEDIELKPLDHADKTLNRQFKHILDTYHERWKKQLRPGKGNWWTVSTIKGRRKSVLMNYNKDEENIVLNEIVD